MSDVKQARELVEAAGRDISALRGMSNPDVFADEIFGLHTQQAAEKLLKAWIAMLGEVYPLTHNLELLLGILQERGGSVEDHQPLVEYTPFAGRIRYETRRHERPITPSRRCIASYRGAVRTRHVADGSSELSDPIQSMR